MMGENITSLRLLLRSFSDWGKKCNGVFALATSDIWKGLGIARIMLRELCIEERHE